MVQLLDPNNNNNSNKRRAKVKVNLNLSSHYNSKLLSRYLNKLLSRYNNRYLSKLLNSYKANLVSQLKHPNNSQWLGHHNLLNLLGPLQVFPPLPYNRSRCLYLVSRMQSSTVHREGSI